MKEILELTKLPDGDTILSGNEITDATRYLGTEGDGLISDSSFGVWPATTNLWTNGGFALGVSGWANESSGSITRALGTSKFGISSGSILSLGSGINGTIANSLITGAPLTQTARTLSLWALGSGSTIGKTLTFTVNEAGGVNSDSLYGGVAASTIVLTGSWQRISLTGTTTQADRTSLYWYIRVPCIGSGERYYLDGAQVETGSVATPYVETAGATATRNAARVQMPLYRLFTATQGWVAMRVRMGFASTVTPNSNPTFFLWGDDTTHLLTLFYDPATRFWNMQRASGTNTQASSAAQTFSSGDFVTIIGKWTSSNVSVSVNGGAFVTIAGANIPTIAATSFDLGSSGILSTQSCTSDIIWFFGGNTTFSDVDATVINAYNNTDLNPRSLPDQCIAFWDCNTSKFKRFRRENI